MKSGIRYLLVLLLAVGGLAPWAVAEDSFYKPLKVDVEGWTIWLDPRLKEGDGAETGEKALRALKNHLYKIKMVMPEPALSGLQKIPIRLELDNDELGNMQYHPSENWLRNNGHDPALVKNVHIPFAHRLYEKKTLLKHQWVVLHELAHGYHDQILGFDHEGIKEAYRKAKESGINQSVLLFTGKKVEHYAETNHKEYFAEMTESYFGFNDFYPFIHVELKEHDPFMFNLLEEIWGKRVEPEKPESFYEPIKLDVEGWTVWLDPRLKQPEGAEVGRKALRALTNQLFQISMVMPEKRLKELRTIPIRLELDNDRLSGKQYHGSGQWLEKNGHDPALAKNVHIPSAASLFDRGQLHKHPWVMLHELVHGYHDQFLGEDYAPIKKAYKRAKESGLYDSVKSHTGREVEHYAMKNSGEFFAEMTETYFGQNDFYPFMRAQLKEYDPETFKLMEEIWGSRP